MLHFQQVHIGYDTPLLHLADLSLSKGKLYTLIGSNGAGKTTLLHTLLGLIAPLAGTIQIDGQNIHALSPTQRALLIGHVPSRFEGVQHLSMRQYIAMGRTPYTNFIGTLAPADWQIVDQVMEQLGISHLGPRDTAQLSDGERQIASIAKALVQQTPVILLDEPTAFLDYANRLRVLRLLRDIAHTQDICILQSSHDLELCLEFSDALLVVDALQKNIVPLMNRDLSKDTVIELAFPNR
jgi:iron complex transport system ATP-binding protein